MNKTITGRDIFISFYENKGFYELAFLDLAKKANWNLTWLDLNIKDKNMYRKLFKICKNKTTIQNMISKTCDYCEGEGLSPHNGTNRCGNCKGSGKVVDENSYEYFLVYKLPLHIIH